MVFVQGAHDTLGHAREFEQAIKRADVFAPECGAVTDDELKQIEKMFMNAAKAKDSTPTGEYEQACRQIEAHRRSKPYISLPFQLEQDRMLLENSVPLHHLERNSEFMATWIANIAGSYFHYNESSMANFTNGNLEGACHDRYNSIRCIGITDAIRDERIIQDAGTALRDILKKYPGLGGKDEIVFVVNLGSAHTRPADAIQEKGYDNVVVEKEDPHEGMVFSISNGLIDEYRGDGKVDMQQAEQILKTEPLDFEALESAVGCKPVSMSQPGRMKIMAQAVTADFLMKMIPSGHPIGNTSFTPQLFTAAVARETPIIDINGLCMDVSQIAQQTALMGGKTMSHADLDPVIETVTGPNSKVHWPPTVEEINSVLKRGYAGKAEKYLAHE